MPAEIDPRDAEIDPEDGELLHALHRLGTEYEPDLTAIRRRIDSPRRSILRSSDIPAPGAQQLRRPRTVLLAAAAVVLISSTVAFGARFVAAPPAQHAATVGASADTSPPGTPGAQGLSTPESHPTSTGHATPSPAASGQAASSQAASPSTGVDPARTPSQAAPRSQGAPQNPAATSSPAPQATSGTPARSPGSVIGTTASSGPQVDVVLPTSSKALSVNLSAPGLLDWLAVGTRSDGVVVRAKRAAAAPVLTLKPVPGATVTSGPFRVSWTGGLPEQDRTGATTWSAAPAGTGWTIDVTPSAQPLQVVLYLGYADAGTTLTVLGGASATTNPIPVGSPGSASSTANPTPAIVTLRLAASSQPSRLVLSASGAAPAARAFLGAVTVSASS